ncbi:unnamed protein product [Linum trigynum]|uniref:Uncharacterized protein n=1 Tax=Linum trigynum TaxID=586398 RepID=A0AAV2F6P8_9ROSI
MSRFALGFDVVVKTMSPPAEEEPGVRFTTSSRIARTLTRKFFRTSNMKKTVMRLVAIIFQFGLLVLSSAALPVGQRRPCRPAGRVKYNHKASGSLCWSGKFYDTGLCFFSLSRSFNRTVHFGGRSDGSSSTNQFTALVVVGVGGVSTTRGYRHRNLTHTSTISLHFSCYLICDLCFNGLQVLVG